MVSVRSAHGTIHIYLYLGFVAGIHQQQRPLLVHTKALANPSRQCLVQVMLLTELHGPNGIKTKKLRCRLVGDRYQMAEHVGSIFRVSSLLLP